jgi:hypothetical protein
MENIIKDRNYELIAHMKTKIVLLLFSVQNITKNIRRQLKILKELFMAGDLLLYPVVQKTRRI